jgi:hypothetical protein
MAPARSGPRGRGHLPVWGCVCPARRAAEHAAGRLWCGERFGGWQAGGAPGGVEAGGGADDQGGGKLGEPPLIDTVVGKGYRL